MANLWNLQHLNGVLEQFAAVALGPTLKDIATRTVRGWKESIHRKLYCLPPAPAASTHRASPEAMKALGKREEAYDDLVAKGKLIDDEGFKMCTSTSIRVSALSALNVVGIVTSVRKFGNPAYFIYLDVLVLVIVVVSFWINFVKLVKMKRKANSLKLEWLNYLIGNSIFRYEFRRGGICIWFNGYLGGTTGGMIHGGPPQPAHTPGRKPRARFSVAIEDRLAKIGFADYCFINTWIIIQVVLLLICLSQMVAVTILAHDESTNLPAPPPPFPFYSPPPHVFT